MVSTFASLALSSNSLPYFSVSLVLLRSMSYNVLDLTIPYVSSPDDLVLSNL